jgi:hypothetical protein
MVFFFSFLIFVTIDQEHIKWTNNIWTPNAQLEMLANYTIFMNRHRVPDADCAHADRPLETFRLSPLLSGNSIVVSAPSDSRDADLFQGIVLFDSSMFSKTWSPRTMQIITDPGERSKWLQSSFALFRDRFAPPAIFERAGVWKDIDSGVIPGVADVSVPSKQLNRTVVISVGEARIRWMYAPIIDTMLVAFRSRASQYGYSIRTTAGEQQVHDIGLKAGDVMVWVGCNGHQLWSKIARGLHARGIFLIYYQTEPLNGKHCQFVNNAHNSVVETLPFINELWDYSRANIKYPCTSPKSTATYRYIPPGYVPIQSPVKDRYTLMKQKERGHSVAFLGNGRCQGSISNPWLQKQWGPVQAWNAEQYRSMLQQHTVFGTIHKTCLWEGTDGVDMQHVAASAEGFRIAPLMSAGGNVIVSDICFHEDMDEYKGIVIFDAGYYSPAGWANSTMGTVQDQEKHQKWASRASELFKARFDPIDIFQKSGFWPALEKYYALVSAGVQ